MVQLFSVFEFSYLIVTQVKAGVGGKSPPITQAFPRSWEHPSITWQGLGVFPIQQAQARDVRNAELDPSEEGWKYSTEANKIK